MLGSVQMWTLMTWLLLLLYPMLSRWSLAMFDCVHVGDDAFLRADPSETCYSPVWKAWLPFAICGLLLYALGLPVLAWRVAASSRLNKSRQSRVQLLLSSYQPRHWYFESLDLLRKLLLTSVILIAFPNTRIQLWLGLMASSISVIVYSKVEPYRSSSAQLVSITTHAQIVCHAA